MTDAESESTSPQDPNMVNKLVLLNDSWFGQYNGPFEFVRDGGIWEVVIPADADEYAGIPAEQAKRMQEWDSRIAIALSDGGVEAHGSTEAVEYLSDEQKLIVAVDSSQHVSPGDIDLSEVDADV